MNYKIAPSLLAADFWRLGEDIAQIEEHVEMLHLDVMDGHFVPNITMGIPVIDGLRAHSKLVFDCHMMTTNPVDYFEDLKRAGADIVTVHLEAVPDPSSAMTRAEEVGLELGLVISPPTPFGALEPYLGQIRMAVIMSVHPGFGGQAFMPEVLEKVERARKWVDSEGVDTDIQVDGGITVDTIGLARDAGANVFVAGTAVFGASDPGEAARELRTRIEGNR